MRVPAVIADARNFQVPAIAKISAPALATGVVLAAVPGDADALPLVACVIDRIHRLKRLTAEVKAGNAIHKYKVVKSDGPEDLVFQGVRSGGPLRDNNILCRFIKPAARTLGLPWVNWRSLRTSHATWLTMAGADVKDVQA